MPSTQIQAVLKYIKTFVSIVILLLLSIVFDTCKEDDATPLTEQRQVAKRLSRTWTSAEVLFSPVSEHEASLKDLVLRFDIKRESEPSRFQASGAPDFFRTNGESGWSWERTGSTTKVRLLNVFPVRELTIDEITETTLTLSFPFNKPPGGRRGGVGEYRVRLTGR